MNWLERFHYTGEGAFLLPMLGALVLCIVVWWACRRRSKEAHCTMCGHDLTGNVGGRCPECGTSKSAPSATVQIVMARRLATVGLFATGAALSFLAAYGSWVEMETRPAIPSSTHGLYLPASACVALLYGLIHVLGKGRNAPLWDALSMTCAVLGVIFIVLGYCLPVLWR